MQGHCSRGCPAGECGRWSQAQGRDNSPHVRPYIGKGFLEIEFHNTGLYIDGKGSYPAPTTGVHAVSEDEEDMGRFKAPSLRNIVRHARDAFANDATIAREWRALNFTAAPDLRKAVEQYERFIELLTRSGAPVLSCSSAAEHLTLDSIYVRDASVMCAAGAILCRMGKPQRAAEPAALADTYRALGVAIVGAIEAPGNLEGGDLAWLGPRIAAVGRGYRTNDEGIRQLRALLADTIDELIVVPLPHYRGPSDVFHLMSIISPVDHDLAAVYSPLMPVPFRERLLDLGYRLVDVPDHEFESMGANVFALSPGRALMVEGNPTTRAALEHAGAEVLVYDGSEISLKGGGGPTCLTRPLLGIARED